MGCKPDIVAGRLSQDTLTVNFADAHPPLTAAQAAIEADRCYYCYDAPCTEACPTEIDVPSFIRSISTGNTAGAARTILEANILGGSCARVCPTEILCEMKCVRTAQEENPVRIGALQRFATDWQMATGEQPFTRADATGRRVAVVGGGPAGLACAHRLAVHGHDVTLFDANPKPGGLNEYGIAAYKVADNFAQREIEFLMSIGGIILKSGCVLGRDVSLDTLRRDYDAVFLGIGHTRARRLMIDGEHLIGVQSAVDFIRDVRVSVGKADIAVGRRVVVIGGGNTAIDAAVQARRLGAEEVTLVYRRGPEHMSATGVEQHWAQTNGVTIRHWASPRRIEGENNYVNKVIFEMSGDSKSEFSVDADMVLKAVGQYFTPEALEASGVTMLGDRIRVDEYGRTSLPGVYAGGDCTAGADLTVVAVREGRNSAEAIHADFSVKGGSDHG